MAIVLVTGSAGFIGMHVSKTLLENGDTVIGIDNFSDYYDIKMKEKRQEVLSQFDSYHFFNCSITDYKELENIVEQHKPEVIIHLAAQAGVRYSLENPWVYGQTNYIGTMNIFEIAKRKDIKKVLYASSSSIYGDTEEFPFKEDQNTDTPISLYAATKKANEVLAYSYHKLYQMDVIGLRFFTVYGEYNRPDMALFKFAKNILLEKPIEVYNNGEMFRAFTYVEDIVNGICKAMTQSGYKVYNIGGEHAIKLMTYIELIEKNLGKKAIIEFKPMHKADCLKTEADVSLAQNDFGYDPKVSIEEGIKIFCDWMLENQDWALQLEDSKQ